VGSTQVIPIEPILFSIFLNFVDYFSTGRLAVGWSGGSGAIRIAARQRRMMLGLISSWPEPPAKAGREICGPAAGGYGWRPILKKLAAFRQNASSGPDR
jgi:hypothetical protein